MVTALVIIAAFALIGLVPLVGAVVRRKRIRNWKRREFPAKWDQFLKKAFPRYTRLPRKVADTLRGEMQVFLEEKNFEPCGGLPEVTEDMKVLVAAQACLLLAGLPKHDGYRSLKSILMYPGTFRDLGLRKFDLRLDEERTLLGESWESGSVVLSWDSVKAGARSEDDGINVVFHEFAHQLDQAMGGGDGVPRLSDRRAYERWADIFQREYEDLVEAERRNEYTLLDPYGAENPAEFFAVATETFFEEGEAMKEEHPELYEAMKEYYGLDTATWDS